jgi:hypothetical protein
MGKKYIVGDTGAGYAGKCLVWLLKNLALNVKYLWAQKILRDKSLTVMQ